ncbi:MAG TPA: lysylphosphatidylglycerol synthase domain-containing protein [Stellaceae bacterium]|nr:lysylphosphatidylglycerol synthase domain-containing protein [Stellaceae bacterium]
MDAAALRVDRRRTWRTKLPAALWLGGGLGLSVWLIIHFGAPAVGDALRTAGLLGLVAIAAFHLISTTVMGLAWWRLRRLGKRWVFIWGRLLRDAGTEVLPLSQLGGSLLAMRSAVLHGIAASIAVATVVVDITMEFCAQIAFATLGVILLAWLRPESPLTLPALIGLGIALSAALGFILLQRRESDFLVRAATRFASTSIGAALAGASVVQRELRQTYRLNRVWPSFLMHFAAWMLDGVEVWLALHFMGAHLSFAAILTMESLLYAARSVAFLVPNAVGVQEGAYVVLGTALGLTPGLALGLSLLKRGRDMLLGIPALLTWQIFESKQR